MFSESLKRLVAGSISFQLNDSVTHCIPALFARANALA